MKRRRALPAWLRASATWALSVLPERLLAMLPPARRTFDPRQSPEPVEPPSTAIRLYVGPTNSAGQGWQWARAAERHLVGVGAVAMTTTEGDLFRFPVDYSVPFGTYRWSKTWQRRQSRAVRENFTHAIVESGKRLFGDVFPGSVDREVRELEADGIAVALLFHGTDIRLPSRHRADNPWSPFHDGLWDLTPTLEVIAARNAALVRRLDRRVFVSTPDLLLDVPDATWLPVVVQPEAWAGGTAPFSHEGVPRVAHAPSKAIVKGSDLVDPVLQRLEQEGLLEYVRITGVAAAEMPAIYTGVDVVLDQFRIGNYGVAACEAMAAGRIVVSHVTDQVRGHVRAQTGFDLPIVEANAQNLESVLRGILRDPGESLGLAAQGVEFVRAVHSGELSARVLAEFLA